MCLSAQLSVALEVLLDIKHVLKQDVGLDLNLVKTQILVKGISAADAHFASHLMLDADPSLAHLSPLLSAASFMVDCYIGFGVPISTDALKKHFVNHRCQAIMEDVDILDTIQDGFIHYQLLLFCKETRLQYLNGHVHLASPKVLQSPKGAPKQHVDHKIANALLKKGTRTSLQHYDCTDQPDQPNGPSSRPYVIYMLARVLRSSSSATCLRNTKLLSQTPLFEWG